MIKFFYNLRVLLNMNNRGMDRRFKGFVSFMNHAIRRDWANSPCIIYYLLINARLNSQWLSNTCRRFYLRFTWFSFCFFLRSLNIRHALLWSNCRLESNLSFLVSYNWFFLNWFKIRGGSVIINHKFESLWISSLAVFSYMTYLVFQFLIKSISWQLFTNRRLIKLDLSCLFTL